MRDLELKINQLIKNKKRSLPPNRGSLQGLADRLKKANQMIPGIGREMNQILSDYQNETPLTASEKQKVSTIFQKALKDFFTS